MWDGICKKILGANFRSCKVSWWSFSVFFSFLQQLKQQRDKLKQYQKKINAQLEKDREVARQLLKDGKKEFVYFVFTITCTILTPFFGSLKSPLVNVYSANTGNCLRIQIWSGLKVSFSLSERIQQIQDGVFM